MGEQKPTAFVIMPFDADSDDIFEYIISPPLEDHYEVRLAGSETHQRSILADIVLGISGAYLVVADLTGLNPNVMWELGVAHALGKRTLVLTRDDPGTLPFDLKAYRVLQYTIRQGRQAEADADAIRQIGEEAISGAADFSNPVFDFRAIAELSPSDPWDFGGATQLEASEPGLLDLAADAEATQQELGQHFEEIAEATAWIGERAKTHTEAMNKWKLYGSRGGMAKARELTDAAANDVFEYTRRMRGQLDGIRRCKESLRETWLPYLKSVPLDDPEERAENLDSLQKLASAWESAIQASKKAKGAVQGFRESIEELKGVSGRLNAAAGQGSRRLKELIELMEDNEALMEETVAITEKRTSELDSVGHPS